jgi:galactokinase
VIVARAPGRVNLIGDHTDYTGGFVLPMAIDRWIEVRGERAGAHVVLRSADAAEPAVIPLDVEDPAQVEPEWARYVAGVVAEVRPGVGFEGDVSTTIPLGAGLSSSAALEVAVALALGAEGSPLDVARLCRAAEQRASGVPCGIMDQLTSVGGVPGCALLIDCHSLQMTPIEVPDDVDVIVVDTGERRSLMSSAYEDRVAECAEAERIIGVPLRDAKIEQVWEIPDPLIRRRARHVVSENERATWFAKAIRARAFRDAGLMMIDSHASLRDDYGVSTPGLDRWVETLCSHPGVYGARLTGAGFGGCVVALARRGAVRDLGWVVRPVGGATVAEM